MACVHCGDVVCVRAVGVSWGGVGVRVSNGFEFLECVDDCK